MVSSTDPAYNLTIYNASSSPYTLQVMTIVALIFVPIVLIYQGWSFWVFRARVTEEIARLNIDPSALCHFERSLRNPGITQRCTEGAEIRRERRIPSVYLRESLCSSVL